VQLVVSKGELFAPLEHSGVERTPGIRIVKYGEIATELIRIVCAIHA
jgi:hypothetical protein